VLNGRLAHLFSRFAPALLCAAVVPLVVIVLVRGLFGTPLSTFRPVLSDEVYYFHEPQTFERAGFSGGYYTLDERLNPSGITPFGSHGTGFVVLYGLVATVFEWHRHSVLVLNLVAIALAGWLWAVAAPLSQPRRWLSVLLLGTFWPMVFWASSGMQESLHHAGAILMAALFARALVKPAGPWITIFGIVALVLLALVRPTWIIVLPLWGLVTTWHSSRKTIVAAIALALVAGAVILVVFNRTVAPYSRGFSFVELLNGSEHLTSVVGNMLFNLRRTITPSEYDVLEVVHRLQYWGFAACTIVLTLTLWRRQTDWRTGPVAHLAIAGMAMTVILGLMLVLYSLTNWAEHRILSAFLLFASLLILAAPGRAPVLLVTGLIVSNLVTSATFLRVFDAKRHDQYVWDRRGVNELQAALAPYVEYHPNQSRWCNTLLTGQEPPYLIAVPAGVGISVVREADQMPHVPYSRYLLVDEATLAIFRERPRVEALATLPYGTLYLNLDADCR
jgi:hypothetical protein